MEGLIEILRRIRDDIDYENEENLMRGGIMTSIDLISLITALEEEYDIEIPATEINVDNFASMESIENMVRSLKISV